MSVDSFAYPDLGLTVERGKVGQPSTVTLDWVTVDQDGQEHDRKLVLGCELLIDRVEQCRELSIVSVSGDADAVADFNATVKFNDEHQVVRLDVAMDDPDRMRNDSEPLRNDTYEDERMFDVADGMGRAILHGSIKEELPELVVKRCA